MHFHPFQCCCTVQAGERAPEKLKLSGDWATAGVPVPRLITAGALLDGCRMAHAPSCGLLIKRDVFPLPVPPEAQKGLYEQGCKAKIDSACKRLAKLK